MISTIFNALRQYSRRKRYYRIHTKMKLEAATGIILDLGGGPASFFATMFPRSEQIILVDIDYNLVCQAKQEQPGLYAIVADGGRLPLADSSISVTVCNSVIEHVEDAEALAAEIRRVSQSYFLQTPNGDFPLETHSFIAIPFYNFIPWMELRRLLCKMLGADFQYVSGVRYLSEQRLSHLFPGAMIAYEKVLGLKKSFYAYYLDEST